MVMIIEEALALVDTLIAPQRLNDIQELVFRQCWAGKTYQEIAETAGYDADYVRVVGSRLWQVLSEGLGERVSKNNLHAVLRQQSRGALAGLVTLSPDQPQLADFPGAALPLDSRFYILRPPTETQVYAEVLQPGALIRIRAPEKWGKTSLMERVLAQAKTYGYQTVRLNFQQANTEVLADLQRFLRWFCANVTQQLQLTAQLDDYWDKDLGSNVSCTNYLQGGVLAQVETPLVIAMDNTHRLFEYPAIAQDFLPLLRVWHEEARNLTSWAKLRLVVVYSTEVYIPLQLHQSPFNVGLPVRLQNFSLLQTQEFARRHGLSSLTNEPGLSDLQQLHTLVDGHPYLLHLAFYRISRGDLEMTPLLADAAKQTGIYSDHLRNYLLTLQADPELAAAFQQVIMADVAVSLPTIAAYKLESMGLVRLDGDLVVSRCELYRLYFRDRLEQLTDRS
jgi:AAA-like domain